MVNPKHTPNKKGDTPIWYNYYAGYSDDFLINTIEYLNLDKQSTILDPWNGTGTTTFQSHKLGYNSIGVDINPALVIIAKARNINKYTAPSLHALASDILLKAESNKEKYIDDPYTLWFTSETSSFIRSLERSVYTLLVSNDNKFISNLKSLNCISDLTSFFYVAIFQTVKGYLKSFETSNPTWIKTAKEAKDLIEVNTESIKEDFIYHINNLKNYIEQTGTNNGDHFYNIDLGRSEKLSVSNQSIDAIITSPPYCTRIDYAIATLPELATLGYKKDKNFKEFRNSIIGTPTISKHIAQESKEWGSTCNNLLSNIFNHESKASKTYYLKYYLQYFDNLHKSANEITRVCKHEARMAIVTQDSYYKEIHVDLPCIIKEMFQINNWTLVDEKPFITEQTMSRVNKQTKKYRATTEATETISIFKKTK